MVASATKSHSADNLCPLLSKKLDITDIKQDAPNLSGIYSVISKFTSYRVRFLRLGYDISSLYRLS